MKADEKLAGMPFHWARLQEIEDTGTYVIEEGLTRNTHKYYYLSKIISLLVGVDVERHRVYPLMTDDTRDILVHFYAIADGKPGCILDIPEAFCRNAGALSNWVRNESLRDTRQLDDTYLYDTMKYYALDYYEFLKDNTHQIIYDRGVCTKEIKVLGSRDEKDQF